MPKKEKFIRVETEYGFEKEKGPKWEAGAETSASEDYEDHPEENQDAFLVDAAKGYAGVLDGMGGEMGGATASHNSKKIIRQYLDELSQNATAEDIEKQIISAVKAAHDEILAEGKRIPSLSRMATTASIGKIFKHEGKRELIFGNIGDSRIYIAHADGRLEQITSDDSEVNVQIETERERGDAEAEKKYQKIAADLDEIKHIDFNNNDNPDLKILFRFRNVIKAAIGLEKNFRVKTGRIPLQDGDVILFTSDGVHDNLTKTEIQELIKQHYQDGPQRISEALIEAANQVVAEGTDKNIRAKRDDKTAVVLM